MKVSTLISKLETVKERKSWNGQRKAAHCIVEKFNETGDAVIGHFDSKSFSVFYTDKDGKEKTKNFWL